MAADILINQAGKPAGIAGRSREDLVTGVDVTLTASGGPCLAYRWRIVSKPIDILVPVRSAALVTNPEAASTLVSPTDLAGTYLVELTVDSGAGLGAREGDVARRTFYAGPALAANPLKLPRRVPAPFERLEHNVPDAIEPDGNTEGWAREMLRRFAVLDKLTPGAGWAGARIAVPNGGPASIVRHYNVASATRTAQGRTTIAFTTALPDGNYTVTCTPIDPPGSTGAAAVATDLAPTGFNVRTWDEDANDLEDMGFGFRVELGV